LDVDLFFVVVDLPVWVRSKNANLETPTNYFIITFVSFMILS
jgi:hypothetical protein